MLRVGEAIGRLDQLFGLALRCRSHSRHWTLPECHGGLRAISCSTCWSAVMVMIGEEAKPSSRLKIWLWIHPWSSELRAEGSGVVQFPAILSYEQCNWLRLMLESLLYIVKQPRDLHPSRVRSAMRGRQARLSDSGFSSQRLRKNQISQDEKIQDAATQRAKGTSRLCSIDAESTSLQAPATIASPTGINNRIRE